ncbi:hypothetical protein [Kluyvera genomosp. 3]|uniref:Alpha/beta hydrolase n=1 Tax=Kluyvera genomosp. 3 TaxID=2774055 RepID=A0A6G9RGJ7_9ENTR|nr:hypothetical protein [Kluyvera genomosp. 3]QIR25395.1 hypothetical protein GY169_00680 [Kluyvera genomosp. 3]
MIHDRIFLPNDNFPVHYRFKTAERDCKHLLIVMSGFNVPDPTVYDFENVLLHCDSHILWIKDDFDKLPAYYLCNNMSFDIEENVSSLILGVIDFLKCTSSSIIGASKGGSMAMYYGIKHNINNIISIVPQFNIGSYVCEGGYWEDIGKVMMGEFRSEHIDILNNKLSGIIRSAKKKDGNIYLFSSPDDHQYPVEILQNLDGFKDYKNFNFILSKSKMITQHNEVANYNIKLILSLIYQFEHGIAPLWGIIHNGEAWS